MLARLFHQWPLDPCNSILEQRPEIEILPLLLDAGDCADSLALGVLYLRDSVKLSYSVSS